MTTTNVKTWRDEVSYQLGEISGKLENMHSDIKKTNGKVVEHETRIDALEMTESNRKAIKKYMAGVWALVGGIVSQLAAIAWKIVK